MPNLKTKQLLTLMQLKFEIAKKMLLVEKSKRTISVSVSVFVS